jgi:alpha-galactosidase
MQIVRDMEQVCPDAWFINYTNPMMRICDAVARHSSIRVAGLCHQYHVGYQLVGLMLADYLGFEDWEPFHDTDEAPSSWEPRLAMRRRTKPRVHIKAAGLNHFSWMLAVHDRETGEDLYPRFAERWADHDPDFEPLTRRLYEAFGIFPTSGDGHLSEYVPWVSDPITKPWEKYHLHLSLWDLHEQMRGEGHEEVRRMADGEASVDHLREAESEGALEIVESVAGAGTHYHLAVNLPNHGYISNLPEGAIVEVPAVSTGAGVEGVAVGALPEGVAELCRREIAAVRLGVDAAVNGDRQAALQCLLLSPCVTDVDVARQILDDYLETYRAYLPQFWV